jgi:hypothetical protein
MKKYCRYNEGIIKRALSVGNSLNISLYKCKGYGE